IPCATPPWTCPRTSVGLMITPQSSTETNFTSFTSPVSGITSTTATWVPNGNVSSSGRKYSVASSPAPSTASHGAVTLWRVQRISVIDADLLHRHSQPVRNDLGEAGLLSLAVRRDARVDRHIAIGLHPHGRTLERPEATDFDVGGKTDPQVAPVPAFRRLFGAQRLISGD